MRTKPSADDLHIAVAVSAHPYGAEHDHLLKNVKEMNFKLVLPRPMSMPVAAPHGPILVK